MSHRSLSRLAVLAALGLASFGAAAKTDGAAAQRARALVDQHAASAFRNAGDGFSVRNVIVDRDGTEHVRMDRQYRGLRVIGGDLVVHARNGELRGISQSLRTGNRPLALTGRLSADDAIDAAGLVFGSGLTELPLTERVIYARAGEPKLAWEVTMRGHYENGAPIDMTYYVDANTGVLLLAVSNVHSGKGGGSTSTGGTTTQAPTGGTAAAGTGRGVLYPSVLLQAAANGGSFNLTDPTRGNGTTRDAAGGDLDTAPSTSVAMFDADNAWGSGSTDDRASVAADAHYAVSTSFDYFLQVHGRNGIANNGAGVTSYVHVGRNWANAAWYRGAMYFGDGARGGKPYTSLDIAGHEVSHGVTQTSAGLVYSGESGALNEATSDIFGAMVERFANNPSDTPDYRFGELSTSGGRYMYKPSLDGKSVDCYSSAVASLGVHQGSGIANHFFYLLAEGAVAPAGSGLSADQLVCNGNTGLAGIGADAAQRIWYRALTVYMTSGTNYAGARVATTQAANDLYGADTAARVQAAWSAVSVN